MSFFKLTKNLETGIEEIDDQHRELLNWANSLSAANEEAGAQKVTETLDNLSDYVSYHFRTEEEAMDTYDYGKLEKHRKQHHMLMNEVSDLLSRTRGKEADKGSLAEVEYMVECQEEESTVVEDSLVEPEAEFTDLVSQVVDFLESLEGEA